MIYAHALPGMQSDAASLFANLVLDPNSVEATPSSKNYLGVTSSTWTRGVMENNRSLAWPHGEEALADENGSSQEC